VDAGEFLIGAQKTNRKRPNYDPDASEWEAPVRRISLAPFFIGRYAVTVLEYESFVKRGGYEKKELWSAGGFGDFSEPDNWAEQLPHPNRPVTGVSWYEASAYCAWKKVRLPSEEEWECAARCGRKGVRFPWGPQAPDQYRANYFHEGRPYAPTPVGMYPEGATPSGIQDLAGNVFEWTTSWFKGESKVARGGCWDYYAEALRVSWRGGVLVGDRGSYVGFRCVRD
jgi:formylglycine-generating enzyme required for sulfatase activity